MSRADTEFLVALVSSGLLGSGELGLTQCQVVNLDQVTFALAEKVRKPPLQARSTTSANRTFSLKDIGSVGTIAVATIAALQQVDDLVVIVPGKTCAMQNLLPVSVHISGLRGLPGITANGPSAAS